ncbi:MAG: 1,4-beta-xylanase [Parafilimonas sp.]
MKKIQIVIALLFVFVTTNINAQTEGTVWSKQKANAWYANYDWLRGCDFISSTAINQLEMWQAETFDTATINRELGYAESIGLNVMRVFLHHVAWQIDSSGFKDRMNTYLSIADKHGIKTIFVFFDDCWNPTYHAGKQPEPKVGIHNSGWIRDPGQLLYDSPAVVNLLEVYVKDILSTFAHDKRIFMWDLYNEPGNSDYGNKSLPLLQNIFTWAREINPDQPLTAGVWNTKLTDLNTYQLANSDLISYHDYNPINVHRKTIDTLKKYARPLVCTEYMARPRNSTFFTIMPLLKENKIVAINWGLVAGKTNTKYAWDTPMPNGAEPKVWFHEIFRPDGTPYNKKETDFIKSLTGK